MTLLKETVRAILPPKIASVHSEPFRLYEPFIDIAAHFAHHEGTVALISGGIYDCSRYNILGVKPHVTITATGSKCRISKDGNSSMVQENPFDLLDAVVRHFSTGITHLPAPLCAGLLGYLSYDLKDFIEKLPRTSVDDLHLPLLYQTMPSLILVEDKLEKTATIHVPVLTGEENNQYAEEQIARFKATISTPAKHLSEINKPAGRLHASFTRKTYMEAVEKIRRYIRKGDVYQVNMSQRFQSPFYGDSFNCFRSMFKENPAPFFAYINAGDHQIHSTSPERFISLDGTQVETRPIKGTRRRGRTDSEDAMQKKALLDSPKDDAELSMIVDLLRNDIGKVCKAGSVEVAEHKRIEGYENVYHLVSIVNGVLDDDKNAVDLIRATFPGGSITGCPKIRAMEIIDELEPVRRHVYTGSIGYISFHGTMDLSIAIRTAIVKDDRIYFSVGGGIVYDSDAAEEYDETLHKGRTLMRSIVTEDTRKQPLRQQMVWQNGRFKPSEEAVVSCSDEGFLFGHGFFETIRIENARPVMFNLHLKRFHRAWDKFFGTARPDVTWKDIISHLCTLNNLTGTTAACKILAAAGKPGNDEPPTLLVTAREYHHRLDGKTHPGLNLAVYPHPRQTPLASHKTMNYLFYKMAGKYALEHHADEAIILNPDNTVSETNTANIFCLSGNTVRFPVSEHVLPGTVETAARTYLPSLGFSIAETAITTGDMKRADSVFVCNSLMGVLPVLCIDDTNLPADTDFTRKINKALFGHHLYQCNKSATETITRIRRFSSS